MDKDLYLELEKADGIIKAFNLGIIDDFKVDFEERAITLIAYKGSYRESTVKINNLVSIKMER